MEESRSEICSNCKRDIPAQNMVTHKFHCARNIRVCPSCKEPVPVAELEDHHHKFHQLLPCKSCKEPVCGSDLEDHLRDSCAHTIRPCRFCELELPRRELPLHEDYCGTRTESCEQCKQYVMIKYKQLHLDSNHGFLKLDEEPDPRPNRLVSRSPKPMTRSDASTSTNNVPITRVGNRIGSTGFQASTLATNNVSSTSQSRNVNPIQSTSESNQRSTDVRLQRPLSNYLDRHNIDTTYGRRANESTSPNIFDRNVPSTSQNRNSSQPKVQNQAINYTNEFYQSEIGTNRLSVPTSSTSNAKFSETNEDTKVQNRSRPSNSTTNLNAFDSRDYTEAGTLKLPPKTNNDSNSNRKNHIINENGPSIKESRPRSTYEPLLANDFSNLRIRSNTDRHSLIDKAKESKNANHSPDFQRAGPSNERDTQSTNALRSDSNSLNLRTVQNLTNGVINEPRNPKDVRVSNFNITSPYVSDSRVRSNAKTNNQNPRPHSVIVPTKTSYINAVSNTNSLTETRYSERGTSRVNSLEYGQRPISMPVKRTNDMPQINTTVQCKNKVQNKTTQRSPKKRAPKPPAPQPPAQTPRAPNATAADHAYWSALQRHQEETRDRQERNAYNLEHGLPPVLSAAEKLEKLRKLDKLMRSDLDSTLDRNKAHCSTWPTPAPSTSGNHNTVEEEPLEPPEIERISLGEIQPMTEEEYKEQVRILEIVYGVKQKDIETEIADLHRAKAKRSVYNTNPDSNRAQNPITKNKQKERNTTEAPISDNNNSNDHSNRNLPKVLNTQNNSQKTGVNPANNNVPIPTASTGAIQKAGSSVPSSSGLHIRTDTEILFGAAKAKSSKPLLAGLANRLNLPSVRNSQKNDRFSDIKRELRELRRGLNEVTAPYSSGGGGAPRAVVSTPPEVHPLPEEHLQLPCEFCSLPCHPDDLVMHQSGCRPDLVHGQSSSAGEGEECEAWIPCEFCTEPVPVQELMDHQTACSCSS